MQKVKGYEKAVELANASVSPRYSRLEYLEQWVTGTQYKDRPNWFSGKGPLWDRAPCVVYPVVQIAIRSNTDICLGEGKFPTFAIENDGGAKSEGGDENSPVDQFLVNYHRLSRFQTATREAFSAAQGTGTTVALYGARNGVPFAEVLPAKWCERELDKKTGKITKLVIEYPYIDEFKNSEGKWEARAMLYRREIDTEKDTVFKPVTLEKGQTKFTWVADPDETHAHKLGFVPAVWYPFMKGCQPVNVIDGEPIHKWATDEIHQHDIARSQWHRCALLSEPQIYETGVTRGYNPTGTGVTPMVMSTEHGGPATPNNPINGSYIAAGGQQEEARTKGPGEVWQYENTETKLGALTIGSDALGAQKDNVNDLRVKIQETLAVVFLDPENIKFAATTSGKALIAIKQRQVDRCAQYREDLRDNFLIPSIIIQLKLAKALKLKVPGLEEALKSLGDDELSDPQISAKYGDFYQPDPAEEKQIIDLIAAAVKARLITREVAVTHVAPVFGVTNIEKLLKELEAEDLAESQAERDLIEIARGAGSGASGGPKKPVQSGSARAPAPAPGRKKGVPAAK